MKQEIISKTIVRETKIKKIYGPVLATSLGYASELLRMMMLNSLSDGSTKPERAELYLMVLVSSLKA